MFPVTYIVLCGDCRTFGVVVLSGMLFIHQLAFSADMMWSFWFLSYTDLVCTWDLLYFFHSLVCVFLKVESYNWENFLLDFFFHSIPDGFEESDFFIAFWILQWGRWHMRGCDFSCSRALYGIILLLFQNM